MFYLPLSLFILFPSSSTILLFPSSIVCSLLHNFIIFPLQCFCFLLHNFTLGVFYCFQSVMMPHSCAARVQWPCLADFRMLIEISFFSYENVVFSGQAEYSYFSADFSLKIFMYYSWIIIEKERIYNILFCGLCIYFVIIFLWLYTIDMYFMYRSSNCH